MERFFIIFAYKYFRLQFFRGIFVFFLTIALFLVIVEYLFQLNIVAGAVALVEGAIWGFIALGGKSYRLFLGIRNNQKPKTTCC